MFIIYYLDIFAFRYTFTINYTATLNCKIMKSKDKDNRTFQEIYQSLGAQDRRELVFNLVTSCKIDACTARNWGRGLTQPRACILDKVVRVTRRTIGTNVQKMELFKQFNINR